MFNFLETSADAATRTVTSSVIMWVVVGVLLVGVVVFWFINNRRYKKQQQDREQQVNSIAVGDKIITIGLLEGEVVEILEDTYVLKTGTDANPGYVRIQSGAIYKIVKPDTEVAASASAEPYSDYSSAEASSSSESEEDKQE